MKKDRATQLNINTTTQKKYDLKIWAKIQSDKKGKRIYYANIVRDSIDRILRYNKAEIDAYKENMGEANV